MNEKHNVRFDRIDVSVSSNVQTLKKTKTKNIVGNFMPHCRETTGNEGRKRNDMQQRSPSCVMASSLSDLLLLCNQHRMLTDGVFGISEGCKCFI